MHQFLDDDELKEAFSIPKTDSLDSGAFSEDGQIPRGGVETRLSGAALSSYYRMRIGRRPYTTCLKKNDFSPETPRTT